MTQAVTEEEMQTTVATNLRPCDLEKRRQQRVTIKARIGHRN